MENFSNDILNKCCNEKKSLQREFDNKIIKLYTTTKVIVVKRKVNGEKLYGRQGNLHLVL